MTRSELIVALLDMSPCYEDIVFNCRYYSHDGKYQGYKKFAVKSRPYLEEARDGYGDRIIIDLEEV